MTMAMRAMRRSVLLAVLAGGSVSAQTKNATLVLRDPVHHHDWMAREPMVVEHPSGTLFVSGYAGGTLNQRPPLWQSQDQGETWSRVNVGTEADGALGNSDVDLAVARDGTLYFASMGFNNKTLEGAYVAMGTSRDGGRTWTWTKISKNRFDDRPWVKVAPDGTAHVVWNDGSGVLYRQSRDRGATWSGPVRIHDHGGSSHLSVGPGGEVAVRIVPKSASGSKFEPGVDLIAVSVDGGQTWRKRDAPGDREWAENGPVPRWVEPLTWDSEGSLYSLWTNLKGVWLARSRDKGETWKIWQLFQTAETSYYPFLASGTRPGELAGTWFSGHEAALRAHLAFIQVSAGDAPPQVIQSPPFLPDSWSPTFVGDPTRPLTPSTAGEYLAAIFLRGGGLGVVSPMFNIQTKRAGFSWWRADIR
jgi:hypothetical protein